MKEFGGFGQLANRLALIVALALPVAGWAGKLSKDLQSTPPGKPVDVIVQFRTSPSANDFAAMRQHGGILKKAFANVSSAVYTLPGSALSAVSQYPNVTYVSLDRKLSGSLEFAGPAIGANT